MKPLPTSWCYTQRDIYLNLKKDLICGLTKAVDGVFFSVSLGCSRQTVSWIFIILSETYNPGLDTSVAYPFSSATDVTATGRPKFSSRNCSLRCRLLSGLLGNVHCA